MLLAVDTSTQWTGLALYDGSQVLSEIGWATRNHHTVELAPAVDRLLKQGGYQANEIECLGVALGPTPDFVETALALPDAEADEEGGPAAERPPPGRSV